MFDKIYQFTNYWITQEFLCYGVGPAICFNIGFWIPSLILEFFIRIKIFESSLIKYDKKSGRKEKLNSTHKKITLKAQILKSLNTTLGPTAISNSIISYLISKFILFKEGDIQKNLTYPNLQTFLINFILLELIGDFFLYFGHRVQHEIPFLWKFHSLHHQLDTPTPISTLFIDPVDATLQGALPMMLAFMILTPHPFIFYTYIIFRIAEMY